MDSELRQRLAAQEELVSNLVADSHMRDLVTRALIATHPHPAAARAAFLVLRSASAAALPDSGFDVGLPAEAIRQMRMHMEQEAAKWLEWFPQPPSSRGTAGAG